LKPNQLAKTTCGTPGYVAPEILAEKPYNEKCDMWSLGVVLFILLSGEPPFYHDDNFELFEIIKRGQYSMKGKIWESVSDAAKDLIRRLLTVDPSKRITGKDILEHPWI
jgi:serine/threonine protein kinase